MAMEGDIKNIILGIDPIIVVRRVNKNGSEEIRCKLQDKTRHTFLLKLIDESGESIRPSVFKRVHTDSVEAIIPWRW